MHITELCLFLIGLVCGYAIFTITTNFVRHSKNYSILIKIPFTSTVFHLHHWILSLFLLILLICFIDLDLVNNYFFYFGLGILFGSVLHGLLYKDRFKIIY